VQDRPDPDRPDQGGGDVRDRLLLVWGVGVMALSLAMTLASAALLPRLLASDFSYEGPLAGGTLSVYVFAGWLQQAALVLGAALVAAHVLLRQLVPLPDAPAEPGIDWWG
jgi:hypothetical protein